MDDTEVIEVENNEEVGVSYHKDEKCFEDKKAEIDDTILMNETIETTKDRLKVLKDQGNDTCGVFKSFFYFFSVNQTPNFPEFVEWCVSNYYETKGVIMDRLKYKIMCPIDVPSILKPLAVPHEFVQLSQEYKEEIIIQFFHASAVEIKESFMK